MMAPFNKNLYLIRLVLEVHRKSHGDVEIF